MLSVRIQDIALYNHLAQLTFLLKEMLLRICFPHSYIVKVKVETVEINTHLQHCCCVQICRWVIADAISRVLESSEENLHLWRQRLLAVCIKSLIAIYSKGKEQEAHSEIESGMLSRLQKLLVSGDCLLLSPILPQSTYKIFCSICLSRPMCVY